MAVKHVMGDWSRYADDVYRIGLGVTMLLIGVHQVVDPMFWQGYYPQWFQTVLGRDAVSWATIGLGVVETVLGAFLMVNRFVFAAAAASTFLLLGILAALVTGPGVIDIIFRDIGLLLLALGVTLQAAGTDTAHPT